MNTLNIFSIVDVANTLKQTLNKNNSIYLGTGALLCQLNLIDLS